MAEIGRWGGHFFEVSPQTLLSFYDLQIKVGSETDTKNKDGQNYLERKNSKPAEISLSVHLRAGLGYKVRDEAEAFIAAAQGGSDKEYLYIGGKKLVNCLLMLTDVSVNEIGIAGNGDWTGADAALTFKQAGTLDKTETKTSVRTGGTGSAAGTKTTGSAADTTAANAVVQEAKAASNAAKPSVKEAALAKINAAGNG